MAVLHQICNKPHRPLVQVEAEVPVELSRIVDRLLAKHPKNRVQSACKLRESLLELARSPRSLAVPGARIRFSFVKALSVLAIVSLCFGGSAWIASQFFQANNRGAEHFNAPELQSTHSVEDLAIQAIMTPTQPAIPRTRTSSWDGQDQNSVDSLRQQVQDSLDSLDRLIAPTISLGPAHDQPFATLIESVQSLNSQVELLESKLRQSETSLGTNP